MSHDKSGIDALKGKEKSSFGDMDTEPLEVFDQILELLFSVEAGVIAIGGERKTGKTDFALLMIERLFEIGLIKECATNIKTDDPRIDHIDNLPLLRTWLWTNISSKVYVFDETWEHSRRRNARTKKNVSLAVLLPEISKGRGKMIIVCQDPSKIDEEFHGQFRLQGVAMKLSKTTVRFISPKFPLSQKVYTFYDVPKTSIGFQPHSIASFNVKPTIEQAIYCKDKDKAVLCGWAVLNRTCNDLGINRRQLNRIVRKFVKEILENNSDHI